MQELQTVIVPHKRTCFYLKRKNCWFVNSDWCKSLTEGQRWIFEVQADYLSLRRQCRSTSSAHPAAVAESSGTRELSGWLRGLSGGGRLRRGNLRKRRRWDGKSMQVAIMRATLRFRHTPGKRLQPCTLHLHCIRVQGIDLEDGQKCIQGCRHWRKPLLLFFCKPSAFLKSFSQVRSNSSNKYRVTEMSRNVGLAFKYDSNYKRWPIPGNAPSPARGMRSRILN